MTSLTNEADGVVTITFTQAQEGFFRCVAPPGDSRMSPEIGLAGNDNNTVDVLCTNFRVNVVFN